MRRLHLRSLFDEAAGWLHSYPQFGLKIIEMQRSFTPKRARRFADL